MKHPSQRAAILTFLLLCTTLYAKDFTIRYYSIRDGLSTNRIESGLQDRNGRLWFATNDGATVYDGYEWKNFTNQNSSLISGFTKIALDSTNRVWMAPSSLHFPIVYNEGRIWKALKPVLHPDEATTMLTAFGVVSHGNEIIPVIGTMNGLFIYRGDEWHHIAGAEGLSSCAVYSLISNKNQLLIGTAGGLFTWDAKPVSGFKVSRIDAVPEGPIKAMYIDKSSNKDKLWLLSDKWVCSVVDNAVAEMYRNAQLECIQPVDYHFITTDHNGGILYGNRFSKFRLDFATKAITHLSREMGFISEGATSGFVDREGNIWITDSRGIDKATFPLFRNYYRSSGLLADEVTSILEFSPGNFVFGHDNGVTIKTGSSYKRVIFSAYKTVPSRVFDFCKDSDGTIWGAAAFFGLIKLSPNGSYTNYVPGQSIQVFSVAYTKKYGLLVATEKGLFCFQKGKFIRWVIGEHAYSSTRKIVQIEDQVFITSIRGAFELQGHTLIPLFQTSDTRMQNVFALCKEQNTGAFLVGAENGLFRLADGKLTAIDQNGFSIKKPVYFITSEGTSNYWIGTIDGLYRWNGNSTSYFYNVADGLAGYETNRAAGYLDSRQNFWIGTNTGLSLYIGKDIERHFPPPLVDLADFTTNLQRTYALGEPAVLDYHENSFLFHFKAISFFNESTIQYRIKLEGYDSDWKTINQDELGQIKYSNLPPGTYRMLVSTRNHFTNWSPVFSSQEIHINSPFYLRAWFIFLILLIFLLSGYTFYRFYLVRRYTQHLEEMVKSRTRDLETSETNLKQTLDNLEELVQKRTIELAYANTMLSKEIEERKNFEVILAESEIRFRKLINESWDMILLTDREGDITFISASVNKLLGYTEKDVVGQQWTNFVNNEDFHYGVKEFLEKKADADNQHSVVFRAYHKDGTERWLEANLINMVDDPSVEAIVAHCRDITEKKAAEEELNKYSQQLEVLNTAKDKLFSIIAHDLRSPFTAILGYASILKVDSNRMSREEINRCATSIETAVKNTLILIESLLDWSRTQLGGIEFNPKPVNLNEIVLEIFYLLHPDAVNKRIALKSEIQSDKTVNADENLLKTIIRNLVHNAIKFTRADGQVMLSSKTVDGFEEISITDTGIGIPEENMENIFNLHSQASRRGTANERGTGLGLTLCKEFIEKHGGSIQVLSKVDSGTTFTFTIPLPQAR